LTRRRVVATNVAQRAELSERAAVSAAARCLVLATTPIAKRSRGGESRIRAVVDRAGALVERYAYDPYGRPLIRESAGRGDMNNDTDMDSGDRTRLTDAMNGTIWDPWADLDDDGDVDSTDRTLYLAKDDNWPPQPAAPTVAQAFSDVDNPFMFQGRPHFAFDTQSTDTEGKLMLNDHRARFAGLVMGRWATRDPLSYNLNLPAFPTSFVTGLNQRAVSNRGLLFRALAALDAVHQLDQTLSRERANHYGCLQNSPLRWSDPSGLIGGGQPGPGWPYCCAAFYAVCIETSPLPPPFDMVACSAAFFDCMTGGENPCHDFDKVCPVCAFLAHALHPVVKWLLEQGWL